MIRQIITICCISLFSYGLPAQDLDKQWDRYLQSIYQKGAAPGFSVVIVEKGEVVFKKAYGQEVIDQHTPMRPESVLPIGSLTKSMTALALMQLVEAGKLNLDKPVVEYLPWFRTANINRNNKITTRMLLNNSSGLSGGYVDGSIKGDSATYYLLRSLDGSFLDQEPGLSYRYSNTGFALAGYLIHALSGQAYSDYLQEHIFQPLGMNHTSTDPDDFEKIHTLYGHFYGIEDAIPAKRERKQESGAMAPAGSLMRSSATDLAAYMIAMLNPEKSNILTHKSRDKLWQAQSCFLGLSYEDGGDDEEFGYGLGWMQGNIEGRELIFHGGSTGTASSLMILDPIHQRGVVLLLNLDYTFINRYQYASEFNIAHNLLRIRKGETTNQYGQPRIDDPSLNEFTLDNADYARYTGSYQFASGRDNFVYHGLEMKILEGKDGELLGEAWRGTDLITRFNLDFVSKRQAMRRYQAMPDPVRFELRADETVKGLHVFGTHFIRRDSSFSAGFQTLTASDDRWNCLLPNVYEVFQKQDHVLAKGKEGVQIRFLSNDSPPEMILAQYFSEEKIDPQGKLQQQKIGPLRWTQRSFRSNKQQFMIVSTRSEGETIQILLSCPAGQLSRLAARDLYRIISSVSFPVE